MAITEVARPTCTRRQVCFAVVAMPTGPLAHAIDAYRQAVSVRVGTNAAHLTQPHCVLARSWSDEETAPQMYQRALADVLTSRLRVALRRDVHVTTLATRDAWHGLELESASLMALAVGFMARVATETRRGQVTCEDRLRVVLATDFDPADHEALTELAHRIIGPTLRAMWEIGLWRCRNDVWECAWRE